MWWIHRTLKTVVEWISLAILIGLTGVVVYATTFRYLGSSPSWYDEVAQILLVWLTYFAAVYAMFNRQHMGFAGLMLSLPTPLRIAVLLLSETLIVAFFGVAAWYGTMLLPFAQYDTLLSISWITMAMVQSVIPITAVLMIAASCLTFPEIFRDTLSGIDREHLEIDQAIASAEAEYGVGEEGKP